MYHSQLSSEDLAQVPAGRSGQTRGGDYNPTLQMRRQRTHRAKLVARNCTESELPTISTWWISVCLVLCLKLLSKWGTAVIPVLHRENLRLNERGVRTRIGAQLDPDEHRQGRDWPFGVPHHYAGCLLSGPAGARGCSCPPSSMGAGATRSQHIWASDIMSAGIPWGPVQLREPG